jgi:hypothetical protein
MLMAIRCGIRPDWWLKVLPKEGVDYNETFAPVASLMLVRLLIAIACTTRTPCVKGTEKQLKPVAGGSARKRLRTDGVSSPIVRLEWRDRN